MFTNKGRIDIVPVQAIKESKETFFSNSQIIIDPIGDEPENIIEKYQLQGVPQDFYMVFRLTWTQNIGLI
jgi:hypothetical protein